MRRGVAIAFLALAIAGCDVQVSVAPSPSPTTSPTDYSSATPSPLSALTPAPTPLLTASPAPSPPLRATPVPTPIPGVPAYGVLVDLGGTAATYNIDPPNPQLTFWSPGNLRNGTVGGPAGYYWVRWIDSTHVLVGNSSDPSWQARVLDLSHLNGPPTLISASGFFAARLPTDVS